MRPTYVVNPGAVQGNHEDTKTTKDARRQSFERPSSCCLRSLRAFVVALNSARYRLIADFLIQRRAGGGQARDGDAVRRGAHVVQAGLVEELDRGRVAAVLAADAHLQVGTRGAAL